MPPKRTTIAKRSNINTRSTPKKPVIYPIRRILAERTLTDGQLEYLVDWLPVWEPRVAIKDPTCVKEWNNVKKEGDRTFRFGRNTVIRCTNAMADDSPELSKRMRENVIKEFLKYMNGSPAELARELFKDNDWTWGSSRNKQAATQKAVDLKHSEPNAAEVLRRTYIQMRGRSKYEFVAADLDYGDIKVRYIGQVDDDIETTRDELIKSRSASTVLQFTSPLLNRALYTMEPKTWKTENMNEKVRPLSEAVKKFATHTPYLLTKPWPLLFTRLFWFSDELEPLFNQVAIRISEDWCNITRDYFLYTYSKACQEKRAIDCVERTYLETRDEIRHFVRYDCDREGRPIADGQEEDDGASVDEDEDVDMDDAEQ